MALPDNLYKDIPEKSRQEIIDILRSGENIRIERIVSYGQASPEGFWYEQDENEWVIVLEGSAELEYPSGGIITMNAGDYVYIPKGEKHRVRSTSPDEKTIWLAFFF
jgi:cupin 2 domain-containing protein